jgi:cytochrome P450
MQRLNLFSPQFRSNPYPYYAELRRSAPVTQVDPGGIWAVSRYDDVVAVFKSPEVFSSQGLRSTTTQPWIQRNPTSNSIALMDPPQHTAVRALVTRAFGSRVIPRVEPLARAAAAAFAARVHEGGEIDVCQTLSVDLPAAVIAKLLGFDPSLGRNFKVWTEDLVAVNPGTPPEAQPRILKSVSDLERYIQEVLADRRRQRRDDLTSDLIDAEVDGRRMSDEELVSFLFLLLVAGFETTSHLLTNSLRILADHPELITRLRADPAAIPAFVEEVLRFEPSVHGTMRLAITDAEVGGVQVPAGSLVLALVASACRDESQIADPDRFDMDRGQRTSIVFGHGAHFCLGAALARVEARLALEELLPHVQRIRVVAEPEWNISLTIRAATKCLMEFQCS